MNDREKEALNELRLDMNRKLNAIMEEQQNAANYRNEIRDSQSDIKRDLQIMKREVDEMRPAVSRGKTLFYVFVGLIFGAGFSFSEIKTWLLRLVVP